jgi:hypothetical protein
MLDRELGWFDLVASRPDRGGPLQRSGRFANENELGRIRLNSNRPFADQGR